MSTPQGPSRDDNETAQAQRRCPICNQPFTPTRRQAYCSHRCRQTAWRRRHSPAETLLQPPPAASRRDQTIYRCDECDTRYLAQQWCPDCTRPCRRLGPGGTCDCGDLLTIHELLTGSRL